MKNISELSSASKPSLGNGGDKRSSWKEDRVNRGYWNKIDSLEKAQEFINENHLLNIKDGRKRFPGFISRLDKLGLKTKVNWEDPGFRNAIKNDPNKPWLSFKELSEFQKFIDDNNIDSAADLERKFGNGFLSAAGKLGFRSKLVYPKKLTPKGKDVIDWSFVKTSEDLIKFAKNNGIETFNELRIKYPYTSTIIRKNNWIEDIKKEFPPTRFNNIDFIHDLNSAQEYINKMGYTCATELRNDIKNRGGAIYSKIKKLKLAKKIVYSNPRINNWNEINTEEDIKKFIIENDIKDYSDFYKRFSGLYSRVSDLGLTGVVSKYYTGDKEGFDSRWERDIYHEIEKLDSIIDLQHNIDLGCKNINPLPFDITFKIGKQKFIVEVMGPTHFKRMYNDPKRDKFLLTRKHDIIKNRWAKDNGYKLFYITLDADYIKGKYSYLYYICTSIKELIRDIKSNICY